MIDIKTDFGTITITKSIIAKIVSEAINLQQSKVILTNHKGKPLGIGGKIGVFDESNIIEVTPNGQSVDIKFYIMIKFGKSIGAITNELIETVRSEMMALTGVMPNSVSVVITGMLSKNEIVAKRNIEIKK